MAALSAEFLLRVVPSEGGFVATCSRAVVLDTEGPSSEGHGATALSACVAALMNSQVQEITETQVSQ